MIRLYELAEYNAARKNKTRKINKTHKDVIAFLRIVSYLTYCELHNHVGLVLPRSYADFWIE